MNPEAAYAACARRLNESPANSAGVFNRIVNCQRRPRKESIRQTGGGAPPSRRSSGCAHTLQWRDLDDKKKEKKKENTARSFWL